MNLKSLLLDNNTIRQTVFKNTFWISLSVAIGKILRAVLIIYVAKILGPTSYGQFAFALAFVSLFVTFFDLGLSPIVTREFSRDREREKEFSSIFSLKILLGIGTVSLIWIGSFFITQDPEIQKVIWILSLFSLLGHFPEIIYAYFRARQKMEYEALTNIFQVVLMVGLGFFIIFNFPSVLNISYGYLFSVLIALIALLIFFHFKFFPLKLSFKTKIWKSFLLMSWPLALTSVFGLIYGYIDSIMMGSLGQIIQTGWYNASLKIINLVLVPSAVISMTFFPALSRFSKESKEKFQRIFNYQIAMMIFLAFPIVIGGIILAQPIIDFIYDASYFPAILALQILIVMAGFAFLNAPFSQVLIAADQQKKIFWVTFFGAIINIILNIVLIPRFSLYGAATATVITYIFMFFIYFGFTNKFTLIKPLNKFTSSVFIKVILASLAMYLVISLPQVYNLHAMLSVLIGAIVYLSVFAVLNINKLNTLRYN